MFIDFNKFDRWKEKYNYYENERMKYENIKMQNYKNDGLTSEFSKIFLWNIRYFKKCLQLIF